MSKNLSNPSLDNVFHITERLDFVSIGDDRAKIDVVRDWCARLGITLQNVAFMGDDVTDVELLEHVGLSACPNGAIMQVKRASTIVAQKPGGGGAVREFVELIIE